MVTVNLLGELGDRFGKEFQLEITTPREAIRAIGYQIDGFFSYLAESAQHGIGYRVIPPAVPEGVLPTELDDRFTGDVLIIAPEIAQGGAVGRIIAGVVLIGISFFMPIAFLGVSSLTVGLLGASLVLGGLSQLLTPAPPLPGATFGAFQDRSASQGKCMPLRYGQGWCVPLRMSGRIVISNTVYTDIFGIGKGGAKGTDVRNRIDTQYPDNYSFEL